MIGQQPPFALATPIFRFRALASQAGRLPLGGDREVVLACLMVSRLAAALLPPTELAPVDAETRASNARQWLASLTLPLPARTAAAATIDAVGSGKRTDTGAALSGLTEAAIGNLDQRSAQEMQLLVSDLSILNSTTE
ncbi:MAG: hypothetical protein ABIS03_09020 [Gemmatimonadaceae bacterium]